jgi:uncharacterized membrane protein YbhN (UPF0104 family)
MNAHRVETGFTNAGEGVLANKGILDKRKGNLVLRKIPTLLKALVSVALVGFTLSFVDVATLMSSLGDANISVTVLAVALLTLQPVAIAIRTWLILRSLGDNVSFVLLLSASYIGMFFSLALPGTVGADVYRLWRIVHAGVPTGRATGVLVIERGLTLLALVPLSLLALPMLMSHPEVSALVNEQVGMLLAVFAIACMLGVGIWLLTRGVPIVARSLDVLGRFVTDVPRFTCSVLAVLGGHMIIAVALVLAAYALDMEVSTHIVFLLAFPVILLAAIPISIAGWGVREISMAVLFGYIGVPVQDAVVLSVLFGILLTLSCLPGGALLLVENLYMRLSASRGRSAE